MSPDKIIKKVERLQQLMDEGDGDVVIETVFDGADLKFLKKNYPFFYDWTQRVAETLESLAEAENEVGFAMETLSTIAAAMKLAHDSERGFEGSDDYEPEEDDDDGSVIEPERMRASDE